MLIDRPHIVHDKDRQSPPPRIPPIEVVVNGLHAVLFRFGVLDISRISLGSWLKFSGETIQERIQLQFAVLQILGIDLWRLWIVGRPDGDGRRSGDSELAGLCICLDEMPARSGLPTTSPEGPPIAFDSAARGLDLVVERRVMLDSDNPKYWSIEMQIRDVRPPFSPRISPVIEVVFRA